MRSIRNMIAVNATAGTVTPDNSADDGWINWTEVGIFTACVVGAYAIVQSLIIFPRTKGRVWQNHLYFLCIAALLIFFTPTRIAEGLFSKLTIAVIGSALPVYHSVLAVATPEQTDDKIWLTYWIAHGSIQYSTEWVDDIAGKNIDEMEWWFQLQFFLYLWLLLPFTDGTTLLFDGFTEPLLEPFIAPVAKKMEGALAKFITAAVSASHMWFLWAAFVFFPEGLKRFIALTFGHVYPLLASIVAATTPIGDDDMYWLTYWSCFMPLLFMMEFLEQWLGAVPGFYILMLFCTAYLMVPLFYGAEKIYRTVLVPIAGLQDLLAYRDALAVKKEIEDQIPKERRAELKGRIAELFLKENTHDETTRLL